MTVCSIVSSLGKAYIAIIYFPVQICFSRGHNSTSAHGTLGTNPSLSDSSEIHTLNSPSQPKHRKKTSCSTLSGTGNRTRNIHLLELTRRRVLHEMFIQVKEPLGLAEKLYIVFQLYSVIFYICN